MGKSNYVKSICLIFGVLLISTIVNAGEPGPEEVVKADDGIPKWQLSLIAGGFSKHFTEKFRPPGGYNETHHNIGLDIGQVKAGWNYAAQAFYFRDSYDEDSFSIVGTYGYRKFLPYRFFVNGMIAAGFVHTSYYTGPIALPLLEIGWWRISAQSSFLPQLGDGETGTEFLVATQLKFKLIEW